MNRLSRASLAVVLATGLSACNGRAGDSSSPLNTRSRGSEANSPDQAPYEAPAMVAVSQALGADLTDIYKAVLLRRRAFTADCVSRTGWSISSAELDERYDPGDAGGGALDQHILQVIPTLQSLVTPPKAIPEDRARIDQIVSCMDQAEAKFRNPNDLVLASLEEFDRAVSARVSADSRIQDARKARDKCAAREGISDATGREPMVALSNMVSDIQASVSTGTTSVDEARAELGRLQSQAVAVERCYAAYNAISQVVVDEVQMVELKARPALIPSIVQQTNDLMEQYRALLK